MYSTAKITALAFNLRGTYLFCSSFLTSTDGWLLQQGRNKELRADFIPYAVAGFPSILEVPHSLLLTSSHLFFSSSHLCFILGGLSLVLPLNSVITEICTMELSLLTLLTRVRLLTYSLPRLTC